MPSKSPKKRVFTCFYLSLFILLPCPVRPLQAQVVETIQQQNLPPPQDIQPSIPLPQPSPDLPQQLPSPQLLPPLQLIPPAEEAIPNRPTAVVVVKRFDIVGSTVFSQEELSNVLSSFLNRPLTLKDIYKARSRITDLYISNGYVTSGAYIPPQSIESGVVKIQVVEGKLENIEIIGLKRLSPNYVRQRILTNIKLPINQKRLIEALQLLQINPLIQNVSAELKEGTRPGRNIIKISIKEADSFSSQVTLDNNRTPAVGSSQRRLQLTEANLLGLGDSLNVGYSNTDGSNSFYGNYTLPINPRNGTLSFSYGTAESRIIEPSFDILNIEGSSRYYELTFRQPIVHCTFAHF
jgi:hemolysin activation/secretion protein